MIRRLARKTNSSVDLNKVTSKQEASDLIKNLLVKQNGNGSNVSNGYDCREKKIAYGLAMKLVFARYQQSNMNTKEDGFWNAVEELYQQYLKHQDRAVNLGSNG